MLTAASRQISSLCGERFVLHRQKNAAPDPLHQLGCDTKKTRDRTRLFIAYPHESLYITE